MLRVTKAVVFTAIVLIARVSVAADLPTALVEAYLQVHTALASDQLTGVSAQAQSIEKAAAALGKDGESIGAGAKKLAAAKDIAAARMAFGELSRTLIEYAEKTKSGFGSGLRLAYCPMAAKSWLQKGSDIRNPYYGAAMLTCGNFKK